VPCEREKDPRGVVFTGRSGGEGTGVPFRTKGGGGGGGAKQVNLKVIRLRFPRVLILPNQNPYGGVEHKKRTSRRRKGGGEKEKNKKKDANGEGSKKKKEYSRGCGKGKKGVKATLSTRSPGNVNPVTGTGKRGEGGYKVDSSQKKQHPEQ